MLRRLIARSASVAAIVGACCLGIVYTSGPAQALDLPGWLTTGTLCDPGGPIAGFKNAAPGALAAAGALATQTSTGAAAATGVAAWGADIIAPAVIGAVIQGCVLPGVERNIIAPWVLDHFGEDSSPVTQEGICPGGTFNGYECRNVGTMYLAQTPVITTDGANRQGGTIYPAATYQAIAWGNPADVAFNVGIDCKNTDGSVSYYNSFTTYSTDQVGGRQSGQVLCLGGQQLTAVWLKGIRGTGNGFYYGFLTDVKIPVSTAPPVTEVTATTQCTRPDGTGYSVSKTSAPVTGPTGVVEQGAQIPLCNAGDTPTKIDVGPSGGPTWSPNLKPTATDQMQYPLCAAAGCFYNVAIDGHTCIVGDPSCANWTLIRQTNPGRVTCSYGPYTVSCDLLKWMERAYDTTPQKVTKTNVDGDPATKTGTASPALDPSQNPTGTAPAPAPSSPVDGCLAGSVTCLPQPEPTPQAQTDACWPSGWGAVNPANWVLQPIKCALRWAFIPPPGTITGVKTAVGDSWNNSAPGKWTVALPGVWNGLGLTSGGCQGPAVSMGFMSNGTGVPATIHPFSACDAPVSYAAQVARAASSFAISFFGGLRCMQLIGTGFGWVVPAFADNHRMYEETGRINAGLRNL